MECLDMDYPDKKFCSKGDTLRCFEEGNELIFPSIQILLAQTGNGAAQTGRVNL